MKTILPLVFASALLLGGCAYTANPMQMKPDMVSPFSSGTTVRLINTQDLEKDTARNSSISTNPKQVTEATLALLKTELQQFGVQQDPEAEKSLSLALDSLHLGNYFMSVGCTAYFNVTTGDGNSVMIKAHNISGVDFNYACNFALTKAVAEIINDPSIRHYLGATDRSNDL